MMRGDLSRRRGYGVDVSSLMFMFTLFMVAKSFAAMAPMSIVNRDANGFHPNVKIVVLSFHLDNC